MRPGTENNAGIVGLGVACDLARTHLASDVRQLACVRNILWQVLNATIPSVVRHTPPVSLPNTPTVSFARVTGRAVLAHARDLAVATGYTFHSGHDTPSVTLLAMGVTPGTAVGAVQLSLGRATTATDVSTAATNPTTAR